MERDEFLTHFHGALPGALATDPVVCECLWRHACAVVKARPAVNLVGTSDLSLLATRHTADSAVPVLLGWIGSGERWADVGTGGGFPGLVVALLVRDIEVCLVEANGKKRGALESIRSQLSTLVSHRMQRIRIEGRRAEVLGRDPDLRDSFDGVLCRALAPLPVALELCLPLVRPGGQGVFFKGTRAEEEIAASSVALDALGGEVLERYSYHLAGDEVERILVRVGKRGSTSEAYPRRDGVPARKPLN